MASVGLPVRGAWGVGWVVGWVSARIGATGVVCSEVSEAGPWGLTEASGLHRFGAGKRYGEGSRRRTKPRAWFSPASCTDRPPRHVQALPFWPDADSPVKDPPRLCGVTFEEVSILAIPALVSRIVAALARKPVFHGALRRFPEGRKPYSSSRCLRERAKAAVVFSGRQRKNTAVMPISPCARTSICLRHGAGVSAHGAFHSRSVGEGSETSGCLRRAQRTPCSCRCMFARQSGVKMCRWKNDLFHISKHVTLS